MRLVEHIFKILAPSSCIGCGEEGSLLCAWCRDDHIPEVVPRCFRCNALTAHDWVCKSCRPKTAFRKLWIRTEYTDTVKQLVHAMKFSYSGEAADLIAAELVGTIPSLPADTVIVPVPTITSHVRQRGYDHTLRMARELSKETHYIYHVPLTRVDQRRQVGLSRTARLQKSADNFRAKNAYVVQGKPVLLIDDVLTTGATLNAAATALKAAGASCVDAVVFARAK